CSNILSVPFPLQFIVTPYLYIFSLSLRDALPISLLVAHTLLHWLVSQSLFYVQVLPFDIKGNPVSEKQLVALGFSPVAIIFALLDRNSTRLNSSHVSISYAVICLNK